MSVPPSARPQLERSGPDADPGVDSPCVRACRIDPVSGFCEGCARTLDEICQWTRLTDDGKRAVLRQLPGRRTGHPGS